MNRHYPLILVCLLFACTPKTPQESARDTPGLAGAPSASDLPPPVPVSDAAGRSGQDSQTWFTDRTGGTNYPRLMYSARGSDEMGINIQCRDPGKLVVTIVRQQPGDKPNDWPFTLVSGSTRQELAGIVQRKEDDELFIEASSPTGLGIYAVLKADGQLTLQDSQGDHEMNAINDDERRAIANFFETCGS